ncbi:MAG TPA: TIGR00153 family protein [Rhabdochlamydiaceae bacterium]|nr:TIGR00153 family protein [Rhabdochlamydiaceae bacterium]
MLTIAKLFGKSPFAPLQTHMKKVTSCVEKLTGLIENLSKTEMGKIEKSVSELSSLEHEADLTKNDIRNHLPKSLFMPIDRAHFLDILSLQDSIADKTEDIGNLLMLRPLEEFKDFKTSLQAFYEKNIEVFWNARQIIAEIDDLLESSFGGIEAEKVKSMVEQTAFKEHEANLTKQAFLRQLFSNENTLSSPSFYLWLRLIEEISSLSKLSEKLANRIRMILELK